MYEDGQNALNEGEPPVVDEVDSQEDLGEQTPDAVVEDTTPAEPAAEDTGAEKSETDEPAEPEGDKVDKTPEKTPEIDKRIEKLEKRLGYEQRQRKKLEAKLSTRPAEPEGKDDAAPKAEDFETYEEYQEAVIEHKVQRGIREYEKTQASTFQETDLQDFIEDTKEAGRERFKDFDKVALADTVPMTKPMIEILQDCENPETIAYYLGKNVAEATAISRMSPTQAARALGKIEAKVQSEFAAAPAPPRKRVSNAPPPVKPTGGNNVVSKDPEKMTQSEYEAWRAQGGGT